MGTRQPSRLAALSGQQFPEETRGRPPVLAEQQVWFPEARYVEIEAAVLPITTVAACRSGVSGERVAEDLQGDVQGDVAVEQRGKGSGVALGEGAFVSRARSCLRQQSVRPLGEARPATR